MACTGEGEGGGGPLRSDAKVPLLSGLCYMNDIVDDKNQYRRSLYAEYVCVGHQLVGGHHPSCSKKKKRKKDVTHHSRATAHSSCLRLNADDHN